MTLVVQNDTGTAVGANAYADLTFADDYFANDTIVTDAQWIDVDEDLRNRALIVSASYIDNVNIGMFKGVKLTRTQETQFPRRNLFDYDGYVIEGIPVLLKRANCEYAVRAIQDSLYPDFEYDNTGFPVQSRREKVGPIEEMVTYKSEVVDQILIRKYPEADVLLKQFLVQGTFLRRG